MQMSAASYFTGLGKTRMVFWVNVLGNLFNAAIDPLLIFGLCGMPRLGMAGAAYATVAATALQWIVLAAVAGRSRDKGDLVPLILRILRFGHCCQQEVFTPSGSRSCLGWGGDGEGGALSQPACSPGQAEQHPGPKSFQG